MLCIWTGTSPPSGRAVTPPPEAPSPHPSQLFQTILEDSLKKSASERDHEEKKEEEARESFVDLIPLQPSAPLAEPLFQVNTKLFSLSQRSPLIFKSFLHLWSFFYSIFYFIIFLSRSHCILQQPPLVFGGAHFCRFLTSFCFSCVGALSSIINSHKGLLFFEEWDGILRLCSVYCVHRHGTFCFKSYQRRLGDIKFIPYLRGLQQNERCEWESNICLNAHPCSQFQLTTPRPLPLIDIRILRFQEKNFFC